MKYVQSPLIRADSSWGPQASWAIFFLIFCLFALVSHWDYVEAQRVACVAQDGTVQEDGTCKLPAKPLPPVKPANLRGQKGK